MQIIGLTGGIASGKSFIADYFRKLDIPVLDADRIGHDIQAPGTPAYDEIVKSFGSDILNDDGTINRKVLGGIVFGDEEKLKLLASITHPRIFEEQGRRLRELHEQHPDGMVVLEVALLIETGTYQMCEYTIVAYCRPEQQLERLMERDGIDEEAAQVRLAAQWELLRKVPYADFVVDTSGNIEWTVRQLDQLYLKLQALNDDDEDEDGGGWDDEGGEEPGGWEE